MLNKLYKIIVAITVLLVGMYFYHSVKPTSLDVKKVVETANEEQLESPQLIIEYRTTNQVKDEIIKARGRNSGEKLKAVTDIDSPDEFVSEVGVLVERESIVGGVIDVIPSSLAQVNDSDKVSIGTFINVDSAVFQSDVEQISIGKFIDVDDTNISAEKVFEGEKDLSVSEYIDAEPSELGQDQFGTEISIGEFIPAD